MRIDKIYHHRDGVRDDRIIDEIRDSLAAEKYPSNYVKNKTIEGICSNLGFTSDHIVWQKGMKKLTVSGKRGEIGLMVWFGNQHYSFKHFVALQLMFARNDIKSAIYITSTKMETVSRNRRISLGMGKPDPGPSTRNYCEFESLRDFLEGAGEGIEIPISLIGISD